MPAINPARVLIACPTLPPKGVNMTGSPALILKLYRELSQRQLDVQIVELNIASTRQLSAFSNTCGFPLLSFALLRKLWRSKPAVLHCHGHISAAVVLPYARLCRIPVVCELHGLYVHSKRSSPGTRPLLSWLAERVEFFVLRHVDHIIVQAEAMRQRLLRAGIPAQKMVRLYPGLRVEEIHAWKGDAPAACSELPQPATRVVYLGSHHSYQGLDLLQQAQAILHQTNPGQFHFVLVMSGDSDQVDVRSMYNFDDTTSILYLKDSREVPAWLKSADILIHSRPDIPDNINVQSKLGLYLAAGRAIVATNVGDYPYLMADLPGCVLCDPNGEDVARALRQAASPHIQSAATENLSAALQHFNIVTNTNTLIDRVYQMQQPTTA